MCYLDNIVEGEPVCLFKCAIVHCASAESFAISLRKAGADAIACAIDTTIRNISYNWAQVDLECLYGELTRRAERKGAK